MAGFTESGITLDFPTQDWFRFEKSQPYAGISGYHYKELDACWVKDMNTGYAIFYAIELKDYTSCSIDSSKERIFDIVKKMVDTIQMFLSARYQNEFGQELEHEKHVNLHDGLSCAQFITIVKIHQENAPLFQALKDECLRHLKGYGKVWDNIQFHILTYTQAQRYFSEFVK